MALPLALLITLLETLALSGLLLLWAKQVAGARLLAVFLLGVATWVVGNQLPNWAGLASAPVALALLATVPLTSAAFLHFSTRFGEVPLPRFALLAAYALAGFAMVLSLLRSPGEFLHFPHFVGMQWVVEPNRIGLTTGLIWAFLAGCGLLTLAWGFWQTKSLQRRKQMAAIAASCAWGLLSMTGYALVPLGIEAYPWQLLLLPLFPLFLVYGVLRYRVLVVNVWARRALASAMLILLGMAAVSLTVLLPVDSKWLNAAVVAATCLLLSGPVWRFASQLVYPGGTASADDLRQWRSAMAQADSWPQLAALAAPLLSQRMGTSVAIHLPAQTDTESVAQQPTDTPHALVTQPTLVCQKEPANVTAALTSISSKESNTAWHTTLQGFEEAPPGQRHLAELFGNVLADAAAQVEWAQQARQREREAQLQARLAELGSLAATVAHDVRNPLNIIAMAVAMAPAETRQEVGEQINRISHLTADLLDYAKPWQLTPISTDVHARIASLLRYRPEIQHGNDFSQPCIITLDPARFDQAFSNLLSNASTAASQHVQVATEHCGDALLIHVCDDGPGIPADMRERLFEPFASRSPGGTGLGLAIVARIMAAHGGSAELNERAPWHTCLTLRFPVLASTPNAQPSI